MEIRKLCRWVFPAVFIVFFILGMLPIPLNAAEVPRISKEELKKKLDKPDVVILDVRAQPDWEQNAFKIKGAKRLEYVDAEAGDLPFPKDKTLILYCS